MEIRECEDKLELSMLSDPVTISPGTFLQNSKKNRQSGWSTERTRKVRFDVYLCLFFCCTVCVHGSPGLLLETPEAAGTCYFRISSETLEEGGGSDFPDQLDSTAFAASLSVEGVGEQEPWNLYVKQESPELWLPALDLFLRVTQNGVGKGAFSAIPGYMELGNEYHWICSGEGSRSNIFLQYRLRGVSIVSLEAKRYSAELLFYLEMDDAAGQKEDR